VIEVFRPPGGFGVRVDSHLYQGYELPVFYDSLIAKLVAWDRDRGGAIRIMSRALEEFRVEPVKTTIPLHLQIMANPLFDKGEFDTHFIQRLLPEDSEEEEEDD
jgi:acetyl-CoA carboxylase biotin carboxylase subunit